MSNTIKVEVVGPNLPANDNNGATFHVHAAGCADLKRGWIRHYVDGSVIEVANRLDVEADVYYFAADENEDYTLGDYLDDFHFAPCLAHLPVD